jgi:hypothetical protein
VLVLDLAGRLAKTLMRLLEQIPIDFTHSLRV